MTAVIAVDGPGGSGKSTVSRRVAERLGWAHLDTGAFYRAAALAVLRAEVTPDDVAGVVRVVEAARIELDDGRVLLGGADVSTEIREVYVTAVVSAVSALPAVRTRMVDAQRAWVASHGSAVVEGRDIGTVVFPAAPVKVFLTADPAERARRRARDEGRDADTVAADLVRRDRSDSTRATSPLQAAPDAVVLDTTELTVDAVVDEVVRLAEAAGLEASGISGGAGRGHRQR